MVLIADRIRRRRIRDNRGCGVFTFKRDPILKIKSLVVSAGFNVNGIIGISGVDRSLNRCIIARNLDPAIVQKKDGTTLYLTRDISEAIGRFEK